MVAGVTAGIVMAGVTAVLTGGVVCRAGVVEAGRVDDVVVAPAPAATGPMPGVAAPAVPIWRDVPPVLVSGEHAVANNTSIAQAEYSAA